MPRREGESMKRVSTKQIISTKTNSKEKGHSSNIFWILFPAIGVIFLLGVCAFMATFSDDFWGSFKFLACFFIIVPGIFVSIEATISFLKNQIQKAKKDRLFKYQFKENDTLQKKENVRNNVSLTPSEILLKKKSDLKIINDTLLKSKKILLDAQENYSKYQAYTQSEDFIESKRYGFISPEEIAGVEKEVQVLSSIISMLPTNIAKIEKERMELMKEISELEYRLSQIKE